MSTHDPAVPEYARLRELLTDPASLVRAVAGGSLRGQEPPERDRVELRPVRLRDGLRVQVREHDATQAFTTNVDPQQPGYLDELLARPYGHWHVETTTQTVALRVTRKGKVLTQRSARSEETAARDLAHDRAKRRRLDPGDPLFVRLGISTPDGQVKPSRRDKHTQVQDFLAALEPVLAPAVAAAGDGPLRVVDLGCGNAYLTFAAHRWLTAVHGLRVQVTGVDGKAQSREHATAVAADLGVADEMEFVQGWIGDFAPAQPPHLVMALHACDTATDDALAQAVRWGTPVAVAAPCCHHEVQRRLDRQALDPAEQLLVRQPILRQRLADVLTDALRAAVLRRHGYRTEVIEFVDSRHTPRNALIRAVRTGAATRAQDDAAYRALVQRWGVHPPLAERLDQPG